ncbi:MAG: UbiA family prenyltransferase [Patescibacteria group bacterium]
MRSLQFWIKVTRPMQALLGGLATYIVATLSDGQDWFAPVKLAAAGVMFMGVAGASIFHYGAAHQMYARKDWDRIEVRQPALLISLGGLMMFMSSALALAILPSICFWITTFNAVAVSCYARWLAKHWVTKNVVIAFVCTTPVLIGWLSGQHTHPALPYLTVATFFAYWTREIIKDYLDMKADDGIRVTLPLWLGPAKAHRALYVAAITMFLAVASLLEFASTMHGGPTLAVVFFQVAIISLAFTGFCLAERRCIPQLPRFITCSNALVLASAFLLKLS